MPLWSQASRRPKTTRIALISVLSRKSVPGISPPARATLEPWPDFDSVSFDTAAVNNCKFYGPGSYSTIHKPGVHHHYATSPPTSAPDHFGSKRCSTACPEADGQIFASPTGEVRGQNTPSISSFLADVPTEFCHVLQKAPWYYVPQRRPRPVPVVRSMHDSMWRSARLPEC